MINYSVARYVVKNYDTISKAYWKYSKENKITIVLDEEDKFIGVVGQQDYEYAKRSLSADDNVEAIVNRDCLTIDYDNGDVYMQARNLYGEYNIKHIPVVNKNREVVDLFSRERAFYKQYFQEGRLERMHYALCIWAAAQEAKQLGYDEISVIEFGVAGGNGLLAAQMHAKEISRIFGIQIQVYGLDTGGGMPEALDQINDISHIYTSGLFQMNQEKLRELLDDNTHLVLGNIEETIQDFVEKYKVSPVGAMFVDVDYYSSTKPILDWLQQKDEYFLPRIFMYFDDISALYEGLGEERAIIEFNEKNNGKMKIAPEKVSNNIDWFEAAYNIKTSYLYDRQYEYGKQRIKICHRFEHEHYTKQSLSDEMRKLCALSSGL